MEEIKPSRRLKEIVMNNLFRFLFALLILFNLSNCIIVDDDDGNGHYPFNCTEGEGSVDSYTLELDDITSIRLKISADVYLSQGPQEVVVEGQENIVDELELDVNSGRWEIEFDDCVEDYVDLKIYITIPNLHKVELDGSGEIFGETLFTVDDIDLEISGSGDIDLELECDDIEADISGSGKIKLIGTCDDLDLQISGSGDYKGFNMECQKAKVEINGSGDAEVRVIDELDVEINGSGDVYYKGFPELDIQINGSGEVINAN